jgi:hypothetical protein
MGRNPYQAHLCAQDPDGFERGFNFATTWLPVARLFEPARIEQIHRAIRDSTGVPFPQTAAKAWLDPTPWHEGFMLGVYGIKALEAIR